VKSADLKIGERYRLRYREFTATGNCSYGSPLKDGEGVLVSMYDASSYNHTFVLDNGKNVWATPNSTFLIEPNKSNNSVSASLVDDIIPDVDSSVDDCDSVQIFLSGLNIKSESSKGYLIIPPNSISKFKKLIYTIYSDIL
jgi:hypothetical protein